MKKLFLALILGLLALALTTHSSSAQAASGFSGRAVRWNGEPIVGATISVLTGPLESDKEIASATTGADGAWSVEVPSGGPYWVHIRTFGEWWGYSYQEPFTLRAGERISQIWLALGPRDVQDIALPAPVSNVAPSIGVGEAEPAQPVAQPGMPRTGEAGRLDGTLLLAVAAAVLLIGTGIRTRSANEQE